MPILTTVCRQADEHSPREFILVSGADTEGRGFGRQPSWREGDGRRSYCGALPIAVQEKQSSWRPDGQPIVQAHGAQRSDNTQPLLLQPGEAGVDPSRHERPHGEPGSYRLTNLLPATPASHKL